MTVTQCHSDFFVYNKKLYQFLFSARNYCIENNCKQIVSIVTAIDAVDPLIVFEKFAQPNKLSFFWQNPSNCEAIVAIDAVKKLEINHGNKFALAEDFLKEIHSKSLIFNDTELDFNQPICFCSFSFFNDSQHIDYPFPKATIFLPRYTVSSKQYKCQLTANLIISPTSQIEIIIKDLKQAIARIKALKYRIIPQQLVYPQHPRQTLTSSAKFQNSVKSALEAIAQERLHKIVLADVLDIKSVQPFNLCQSLNNLRHLHPNCYIFATANSKGQYFIGASPERLISIHNRNLFVDALAGSAPRGQTPKIDAKNAELLLNSVKERHEHRLVIDFITQQLWKLGLVPQVLTPRIRQLSNIQHLWTPIHVQIPDYIHPLQIVAKLHPTPAVAGAERNLACQEIRHYENFERGLYAAPLGWVDAAGNSEFIVGIRSALIDCDRARLYAGAGIVAGSDPVKEFSEIQLKFQALLKTLV